MRRRSRLKRISSRFHTILIARTSLRQLRGGTRTRTTSAGMAMSVANTALESSQSRRARAVSPRGAAVPAPKVTLVDDASETATVVEVRAHDAPGLLWRVGRALGECGLDVRAARVETLGAEVVDVFYVVDGTGQPVRDLRLRGQIAARVLEALTA